MIREAYAVEASGAHRHGPILRGVGALQWCLSTQKKPRDGTKHYQFHAPIVGRSPQIPPCVIVHVLQSASEMLSDTAWTTIGGVLLILARGWIADRNRAQAAKRIEAARSAEHQQTLAAVELAKAETQRAAAQLALVTAEQNRQLVSKLEDNTDLTQQAKSAADAAYSEANTVNKKLETIGVEMRDKKPLAPPGVPPAPPPPRR